jgi:scyllo-inositol 2-dehydrogenase (NADP+)
MAGRVFHAPLIAAVPELELSAIAGRVEAGSLIADPSIDLMIVATPHDSHAELAERALRAGKHVVVDKAFVLSVIDGERLIELADRQGKVLTVFHNRRWDGDFLTTAVLLRSGRLGQINLFETHWDRFRPNVPQGWREDPAPGAGTLWNLGPHLIDQVLQLFGMPGAVQADISYQRQGTRVDDYFSLTFHYGPMRAVLSAANTVTIPRPRFAAHGSEGSFVKFGLDPQEQSLASGCDPLASGFGDDAAADYGHLAVCGASPEPFPTLRGCYLDFYRGVAAAICNGGPPPVDPQDAVAGLRLIDAAQVSSAQGRVVQIAT